MKNETPTIYTSKDTACISAPCQYICPIDTKVPTYVSLISRKRFKEAWDIIKLDNPIPSACARVCPHKAIIFPKYTESPINGNDVDDSQDDNEKINLDSGAIDGGDIYEMLKQRSRTGKLFKKNRVDRQKISLTKLKEQLSIPSEVLESLRPSEVAELKKKSEKKNSE